MKNPIVAAIACLALAATPAVAAQSYAPTGNSRQQVRQHRDAQGIVDSAAASIKLMESNHNLDHLLRQARAVFIVPTFFKGALVVGGEGGAGVLLARANGRWSNPAFLSVASGSIGPQVGGKVGALVVLLMTPKAVDAFSGPGNFSLNANAGFTIVNFSAKGQSNVGKADVVVWSGASGAFVGASVSGAGIHPDFGLDQMYYGKRVDTQQILAGQVENPGANGLRDALPS